MVINKIERISAPLKDVFYQEYILAQRPVIITNLFENTPLSQMNTLDKVRNELAEIPVRVCHNYIAHWVSGKTVAPPQMMNLGAYLDLLIAQPLNADIYIDDETPKNLLQLLPLNQYRDLLDANDLYSHVFAAGGSNYAHLHYDVDQRHVLLFQVYGKKRFVLIYPRETQKLDPIDQPNLCCSSGLFLEYMSEEEKTNFLDYTNAFEAVLHPGETIFMPMMIWHYIEYLEPAMSVVYRLGRNSYNRRFAQMFPAPSIDVQSLASLFMDEKSVKSEHISWLNRLENISSTFPGSASDRQALLNYLCLKMRGQSVGIEPIKTMQELTRRQKILEQASLYSNLEKLGQKT